MSSGRLQQQSIRPWQCYDGETQDTTLNEPADLLSYSRRHMRTLLNTMQGRGWLTWEAEIGRGKRSRLTFLYTGLALQQQHTKDLLEQGRIDQSIRLVGDKTAVRQMPVSHLDRGFRQGWHIMRVLYYHPMHNLLPGTVLRCPETHIAQRIFGALIRVNEEDGELEADIVHHWQQISPLHRRFFLHPGVHLHHGHELGMGDVVASLRRINALPLYSHITQVVSPTVWALDIHLTQPDRWLSWLLGQVPAMVLPREWEALNNFSSHPISTGPYAVMRDTNNQLKIHAFNDYLDYRALIDEVNVWVLPDIGEEPDGGLTLKGPTGDEKAIESRLEEGCYCLLLGAYGHHDANQGVHEWASRVLSPTNLICHADEQYQRLWFPAYGLLPRWHHTKPGHGEKPAGLETLTIIYYRDHIRHRIIVQVMKTLLVQHQVQLNIQEIDYDRWHTGEIISDIWLNSANFTLPLDFSLFVRLYRVPLLQDCVSRDWENDAARWRTGRMSLAT